MKWHDCKTDPPKEAGIYVLVYKYIPDDSIEWTSAFYIRSKNTWEDDRESGHIYRGRYEPIKWAEVNLDEDN